MKRRTLIRCIALAPLATGVSCGRASSPGGQAENLQPGHDPRDFGALADGKTLDTEAIKRPSERHRPLPQRYPEFSMSGKLPLWALSFATPAESSSANPALT